MLTSRGMALVVVQLSVLGVMPAAAQEPAAAQRAAYRGPALELYVLRSSAWTAELQDPARNTYDIPAAGGLGLSFAWAITPHVAPFVAADVALYGESDPSAITTVTAGVEGRLPLGGRAVPRATVGFGHLRTSGGIGYDYLQLGAGADLFVGSRIALRGEVEQQIRLGEAKGGLGSRGLDGPLPTVPAVITGGGPRVSIGAVWYMGRRSGA